MIQTRLILPVFCVFFLSASCSLAQEGTLVEVRDLETWNTLGFRYKTASDWDLNVNQSLRLKSNSSLVSNVFTEFEAAYKGWKRWEIASGFRVIRDNDTQGDVQGWETHLRYHYDLTYGHKVDRFKLSYRLRYQSKNELGVGQEDGDYPSRYVRLKVSGRYNIRNWKLDPRVSAELFRHYEQGEINRLETFRWTVGTSYDITDWGTLRCFYRMERELYGSFPKTTNIIGASFRITLNASSS